MDGQSRGFHNGINAVQISSPQVVYSNGTAWQMDSMLTRQNEKKRAKEYISSLS